jgi:hypothetical protein
MNKKFIFFFTAVVCFLAFGAAPAFADKAAGSGLNREFLTGKWVAKGGNPCLNVYTFNEDNTFLYQFDDFGADGKFVYHKNSIILKAEKNYFGNEEKNVDDSVECEVSKIDSVTISINGTSYKNILSIKDGDDWYGNGENW